MRDLIESTNNIALADTAVMGRKFGIKLNRVNDKTIDVCRDHEIEITPLSDILRVRDCTLNNGYFCFTEERIYRGSTYTAYLISEKLFMLVGFRFKNKLAFKWQQKFIDAFDELNKQQYKALLNKNNPKWLEHRDEVKELRRETTDIIQELVIYATKQGNKKAGFYYSLITNATYKALGLMANKRPKLRDTLNNLELMWLSTAEQIVQKSLVLYMRQGLNYKDVYKLMSKDLQQFGEPLQMLSLN